MRAAFEAERVLPRLAHRALERPSAEPCSGLTTQVTCGAGSASWAAEPGTYRVQVARGSGAASGLVVNAYVPESGAGAASLAAALSLAALRARARRA